MVGRKPVEPAESLIARLRTEMECRFLNQMQLAECLKISPATISRALSNGSVSAALKARAEAWLNGNIDPKETEEELHLLRKTFTLLQSLHDKLDALAIGMERRGSEGGDE